MSVVGLGIPLIKKEFLAILSVFSVVSVAQGAQTMPAQLQYPLQGEAYVDARMDSAVVDKNLNHSVVSVAQGVQTMPAQSQPAQSQYPFEGEKDLNHSYQNILRAHDKYIEAKNLGYVGSTIPEMLTVASSNETLQERRVWAQQAEERAQAYIDWRYLVMSDQLFGELESRQGWSESELGELRQAQEALWLRDGQSAYQILTELRDRYHLVNAGQPDAAFWEKQRLLTEIQLSDEPGGGMSADGLASGQGVPGSQTQEYYDIHRGESLWTIARKEEVYNDPYTWPLLYKENADQIDDADLIYPQQRLRIPAAPSSEEINKAREHARQRGPWSVGPAEASDRRYLQQNP